jgi:hypothetical protein
MRREADNAHRMKCNQLFRFLLLISSLVFIRSVTGDTVHTPAEGTAERKEILATLHKEYTTGSGSAVKFKVNYLKVHDGWAWINVTPLDPKGKVEGEEWPSLLQQTKGQWQIIDLMAIAGALNDPVGPMEPSPAFLRAVKKRYPAVPNDIFPRS